MANTGFSKTSRLLKAFEFEAVFTNNQFKVANRHFLILALQSQHNCSRLGMVVAKKNIPLAVQRNRVKRMIRESFRHKDEQSGQSRQPECLDIVVLVRKGADKLRNPEIMRNLTQLWHDLERKCQKAN